MEQCGWLHGAEWQQCTLGPDLLNLVVGDTQAIQALGSNGQPVTGLTWASSNPAVVSLSTADPPILSALGPGHATITGGAASADVTVSAAPPPSGTVLWSNLGDGSGVGYDYTRSSERKRCRGRVRAPERRHSPGHHERGHHRVELGRALWRAA